MGDKDREWEGKEERTREILFHSINSKIKNVTQLQKFQNI